MKYDTIANRLMKAVKDAREKSDEEVCHCEGEEQ